MPHTEDLARSLGFLINDLARLLRRNFDRRVRSLGLTQAQWRAIVHLARNEGATQSMLAESLEIQPITLARLIDRMAAAGWVERRSHPQDRRAVCLFLTSKAQPVLEEMHARAGQTLAEAVAGLSMSAQRQLVDALIAMKHNLAAAEAAAESRSSERTQRHVGKRPANSRRAR